MDCEGTAEQEARFGRRGKVAAGRARQPDLIVMVTLPEMDREAIDRPMADLPVDPDLRAAVQRQTGEPEQGWEEGREA